MWDLHRYHRQLPRKPKPVSKDPQMARNVRERKIFGANQVNRWPFKHCVVLLADKSRILYGFLTNIMYILEVDGI